MTGSVDGNVFLISDFDDAMEQQIIIPLISEVAHQSRFRDGRIDLHINSVGGYVHVAQHIIEVMELAKSNGVVVRTIVPHMAYSAGSMVAVAGTPGERYMAKRAEHLIHYGQTGSFETTPEQIDRYQKWKDRGFRANIEHYKRYCDIPDLEMKIADDGFFVTSAQAKRWGMADKFMDKMPLF